MRPSFVLILAGTAAASLPAQSFIEVDHVDLRQLIPTATNGHLGQALALADDGRVLLAAAPEQDDPAESGSQDGIVFSFAVQADGTLHLLQEITTVDRFQLGNVLAADRDWAAIGEVGTMHMYRLSGATWTHTQMLDIADAVDPIARVQGYARSVAMDGDLLALGYPSSDVTATGTSLINAGAVVLYRRTGSNTWEFEAVLSSPTPTSSSGFGEALAVSGDTVLVGASNDSVNEADVGGAYLFQRASATWNHAATLRNPEAEETRFGWSVALAGDVAVVGCPEICFTFPDGPTNVGSFFSFERDLGGNGAWGLRGQFVGSTPGYIDGFSSSLRLRGNVLLVGEESEGEASFFVRRADGWEEVALLPSGDENTEYGGAVDFMAGKAFVGAATWPNPTTSSSDNWGAVSAWYSATVDACGGSFDGIFCDRFETGTP